MGETEPMMCYAWSFVGAPASSEAVRDNAWIEIPGAPRLASTRATIALERAKSSVVSIYRCVVAVGDNGLPECSDAMLLTEVDAEATLRYFGGYCARSVLDQWKPDDIVLHYLRTNDLALRGAAHHSAWVASGDLDGTARLAARVAMYAAHPDAIARATREAARIALSLRGASSLKRAAAAHWHQERVLSAALMLTIEDSYVQRAA